MYYRSVLVPLAGALPLIAAGCASGPVLKPLPVPAVGIHVATTSDSVANDWIGVDPATIALIVEDGIVIAVRATVGTEFATLRLQAFNRSSRPVVFDPFGITVLDPQRIELSRARPDQIASRIAAEVRNAPVFPPRYIVTTSATASASIVSPYTAVVSGREVATIERDPVDAAVQNFSDAFTAGFNRGVLNVAEAAYREGFVEPVVIQPGSGQRGRLYFFRSRGVQLNGLILRLPDGREVVFQAAR